MAAGPWVLTNAALTNALNGTHDFDSDSWKVALVTSSSNIGDASTTWAGVTSEVANGNGYTTGGNAVTLSLTGTKTVNIYFNASPGNPVWTASGSGITARWAVLYEVGGNVFARCLLDSTPADVTATAGNTISIDSDNTPSAVASFTTA